MPLKPTGRMPVILEPERLRPAAGPERMGESPMPRKHTGWQPVPLEPHGRVAHVIVRIGAEMTELFQFA